MCGLYAMFAMTMRADCKGAKVLVLCVTYVNAHTHEKMDICAYNMCVQAVENVDSI